MGQGDLLGQHLVGQCCPQGRRRGQGYLRVIGSRKRYLTQPLLHSCGLATPILADGAGRVHLIEVDVP